MPFLNPQAQSTWTGRRCDVELKHVRCWCYGMGHELNVSWHESLLGMHGIYGTSVKVVRKNMCMEGMQLKVPPEKVSSLLPEWTFGGWFKGCEWILLGLGSWAGSCTNYVEGRRRNRGVDPCPASWSMPSRPWAVQAEKIKPFNLFSKGRTPVILLVIS